MIRIEDEMGHGKYYHTGGEVAKALGLKDSYGKTLGRNKFYKLLREHGILMADNMPYQYHIMMDLVVVHQVRKGNYTVNMVLFSDKGINYISNKFKTEENGSNEETVSGTPRETDGEIQDK